MCIVNIHLELWRHWTNKMFQLLLLQVSIWELLHLLLCWFVPEGGVGGEGRDPGTSP